ncbi:MAG: oligosaccharide flippase family protein, partial [Endomicrobium sp.]|nr:oligosaccharide flippase family protein [Endomicrobium sp.]
MNQRKAGAVLSYTSMGIHSLIGFIYIPMLLLFLNKEQFGLYQLVGSMIAYLLIMDFGLANTTTRYYCAYLANGEKEKQENLLATMLILYGVISALIIAAGIIFFHFLTPFYYGVLSSADILNAKKMFYILLFNAAITVPSNIFTAIINSRERFIFARCLNICNTVIQP